jgi:hypothetical protein
MSRLEPSARPLWPPRSPSIEDAPVEVTGCEVSGEGRTPGSWSMGVGASGVVVGDDGDAGWRPMPMLRLRNAIFSSQSCVCC